MALLQFPSSIFRIVFLIHILLIFGVATSRHIVKTLPGFDGELPFVLETGYVTVGESELFFYFVESEGSPTADPVILYLNGGPGCSGLNGLFYQAGPLIFNVSGYRGGLPQLLYYPYGWTKLASIIFVDAPVGTGFSYSTAPGSSTLSDTQYVEATYLFIKKWLVDHPDFSSTQFFIAGDSYSGLILPIVSQKILSGNIAGTEPYINLIGYIGSSPHTNQTLQENFQVVFAHNMALICDDHYETLKVSCQGNYVNVDQSNARCVEAMKSYTEITKLVNKANILEPKCTSLQPRPEREPKRRILREEDEAVEDIGYPLDFKKFWCRNFEYLISSVWGNFQIVQEALQVRKGMVESFYRCSINLVRDLYTRDILDAFPYHKNLTTSGLQVLIFSGDHDMVTPHQSTEFWVRGLNVPTELYWRPWFVDAQVKGYTTRYAGEGYMLTYATVKGAGHSAHEYRRRECYEMFRRWISFYPV